VPIGQPDTINVRGDLELIAFAVRELRRSYSELPVQWMIQRAQSRVTPKRHDTHSVVQRHS
jgi:hypothetical protein